MTEEQINIAIAESLGYVKKPYEKDSRGRPCAPRIEWFRNADSEYPMGFSERPNYYHSSLDACAEFEAKLTLDQGKAYVGLFDEVCGGELSLSDMADSPMEYLFWCVRATPLQKCEAYLRVIGKWEASA